MTNQQERVLIALGRMTYPRTPDALVLELGYPKASIRRTVNELRAQGYIIDGVGKNKTFTEEYYLRVADSKRNRNEIASRATMGQTETPIEATNA